MSELKSQKIPQNIGRVGVLYGGLSAEREVSLESGSAVINALSNVGVDCIGIDIQEDVVGQLTDANINCAFIALHGGVGEDGHIQALLDILNIPYTGSGAIASGLAMDKLLSKQLWSSIDIATPTFAILDDDSDFEHILHSLGGSVILKPANEGSSIGMAIAQDTSELVAAYKNAKQYDTRVFVEQLLTGGEYTVAILDGQALAPIKLETDHSFYDYHAKYIDDNTRYICPCGLSPEREQALKKLSLKAFDSLQCKGWGRVDVMMDEYGNFKVLEVNTVPGMTSHSLVPMAAKAQGMSFDSLVIEILQTAL